MLKAAESGFLKAQQLVRSNYNGKRVELTWRNKGQTVVAVSPGEVPWNDAEKARMQALNGQHVAIDYAFMVTVEKIHAPRDGKCAGTI